LPHLQREHDGLSESLSYIYFVEILDVPEGEGEKRENSSEVGKRI
jgi:hypothetical protein